MNAVRAGRNERTARLAALLESVHARYHRPELIEPDPLQFLRRYPDVRDRELVALLASGLAFGNVKSIVASVDAVLRRLDASPARAVQDKTLLGRRLAGFRHRWVSGADVERLLTAACWIQKECGTLGAALSKHVSPQDDTVIEGLAKWYDLLKRHGAGSANPLLSDPAKGGACKRLLLLLRWMVRCDAVDPGGWTGIRASQLVVPLDVHMHRMGRVLGLLRRRTPDLKAARELTNGFRRVCPEDPVRYDFALTRLPIHEGLSPREVRAALTGSLA